MSPAGCIHDAPSPLKDDGASDDAPYYSLKWEYCVKSPEQGAREGAPFIARHIIETTDVAFDDFAGGETDVARHRGILGLD